MNVLANLKGAPHHTPRYFCGDWGSLAAVAGTHCYDVILTAGVVNRIYLCVCVCISIYLSIYLYVYMYISIYLK